MDKMSWKGFAEQLKRADADTIEKTEKMIDWLLEQKKPEDKEKMEIQKE